ncbi:hypothetical protein [Haloferula sp. A504]|uniref:hypothetical protein n=1 Tax=Haloferula sp. A504 TaxID=3373601 RepID=UPI0031BD851D|nr:hypothetical protein [Verrucomicrobiaceae bacterium E54]
MSIDQIKEEIRGLSGEERHKLSSFLTELALEEDQGYWERIRRRVEDQTKESWISVDDLAVN